MAFKPKNFLPWTNPLLKHKVVTKGCFATDEG